MSTEAHGRRSVVADLDGTILDRCGELPLSAAAALDALARHGHALVIATERTVRMLPPGLFGIRPDAIITGGGGHVALANGTMLSHRPFLPEQVRVVREVAADHGLTVTWETDRGVLPPHEPGRPIASSSGTPARDEPVAWLAEADEMEDVHQAVVAGVSHTDRRLQQLREFGLRSLPPATDVGQRGCAITRADATKADAMKIVLDHLGLQLADSLALGDSVHDVEMLRLAAIAVAMGNAEAEVRAVADMITGSAEAGGFAGALGRLGLLSSELVA